MKPIRFNRCGKCDRKISDPGLCGRCASGGPKSAALRIPRVKKPRWSTAKPRQGARYVAKMRCANGDFWPLEVEQKQSFVRGAECPRCKAESIEVDRFRATKAGGKCLSRCWNASQSECHCICFGENHQHGPPIEGDDTGDSAT